MRLAAAALLAAAFLPLAACGGGDTDDAGDPQPAPASAGAPIPSGGLSVPEAIASDLDGPLLVRGYVIPSGDEWRLCEGILESYPPQCGEPSLLIEGVPRDELRELMERGRQASLLGEVDGDTLRVSNTST